MVQVRLAWETFRPWTCFPKTGTTLMTQVATDNTEESSSNSKSSKETGIDIDAI